MSVDTINSSATTTQSEELVLAGTRRGPSYSRVLWGAAGIAIALVLWEILAYLKDDPILLPTVQETARTFWDYLGQKYPAVVGQTLWQHALVSVARIVTAWGAGVVLGVAIGGLMASVPLVRHLIDPLVEITRPIPPLAFIP